MKVNKEKKVWYLRVKSKPLFSFVIGNYNYISLEEAIQYAIDILSKYEKLKTERRITILKSKLEYKFTTKNNDCELNKFQVLFDEWLLWKISTNSWKKKIYSKEVKRRVELHAPQLFAKDVTQISTSDIIQALAPVQIGRAHV